MGQDKRNISRNRIKRTGDDSMYQSKKSLASKLNSDYLRLNTVDNHDNILFEIQ